MSRCAARKFRLVNLNETRAGLCLMLRLVSANKIVLSGILLLLAACSEKPPQIAYLPPLDRLQDGFLDAETYQIVSYGRALDFSKPLDPKLHFFPTMISEAFDQEEFVKFSAEQVLLLNARKPVTGIPLAEILAAETNQLNPQEVNLSAIDEKIRAPMEIKRVLFDNACANARILGLYRWLISEAAQMKLLHGATLPHETISKTPLDPRFFPPRDFYVAESAAIIKNIDQAMLKKKYRYEIVHEVFSKPAQLECKIAIHIHKRKLQLSLPFLSPL